MSLLVVSNVLQLIVEHRSEAGICELFLAPLGQSLLVESILEVLKLHIVSKV
jgi:hypothetical protein